MIFTWQTPPTGNDDCDQLPVEEYIVCPQGTAAAENMMVPVEARIESDLPEDDYFNFSVRMHTS